MLKTKKTILIPDHLNPNIEYEVDLEDYGDAQFIGPKNDNNNNAPAPPTQSESEQSAPSTQKTSRTKPITLFQDDNADGGDIIAAADGGGVGGGDDAQSILYDFLGMVAFEMSVDAGTLLRPQAQPGAANNDFLKQFEAMANQSVYGGAKKVFEDLRLSQRGNITLKDVIGSGLTRGKFAELVAASMRHGAGGSAQLGRIYVGASGGGAGGGAGGATAAYNVHAGYKHRMMNSLEIGKCKLWFSGVRKNSDTKRLYYTEPYQITQWKQQQYMSYW